MKINLSLAILIAFLLSSCYSTTEPLVSVSQGGQFVYTGDEEADTLQQNIIDICEKRNCSSFEIKHRFSDISFNVKLNPTTNDSLDILKFKNNLIDVAYYQKDMKPPSFKTILVLSDLRDQGFSFKFIGGEKWHCDEKPLKRRYCTQERKPKNNQDFLEHILQDNHMDLEEIKRNNEHLLSQPLPKGSN